MKFTAKGRKYEIESNGVIIQKDHRPFAYDPDYSAIYDKEQYVRESEKLQAMRFGFVQGANGKDIDTLLDIGYGNGAFLKFAEKHIPKDRLWGYDVTGVPLDGAYKMPKIIRDAEVITMWDVLEHIPDCSFLAKLECQTVCISLPYSHHLEMGLDWFENEYPHLKPDEHIRHFNPWSLKNFMIDYGWKWVTESAHEDIVRKSKHGLQNIISMAFKKL